MVDYFGYPDCIKLASENCAVVLGHHCGGRVLEYSWQGENSLYLDPAQRGWVYEPGQPTIRLCGGRLDIGPEKVVPKHPDLWFGGWTAEVTGPRSARLISVEDEAIGVQLVREFELDESSSHLVCTQIIENVSDETKTYCHWSRTLAVGGGICVIPLTPNSRFPNKYVMCESAPRQVIRIKPEDPNIRVHDGFLEIVGPPEHPKLGMDSYAGWFCYLMRNDLLFVKRFPVYPERVYNEVAAFTISIFYHGNVRCELEPIGPREIIHPGESASFTEDWWLLPYKFPQDGEQVDLDALAQFVDREAR